MGMTYKRGNVWWIKYYMDGKPFRESSGSKKESDAKRLLKKREGEVAIGKIPGVYFDRVKFEELAQDYINDFKINGRDVRRAELSIRHLKITFGGKRIPAINTPLIQAYIKRRQDDGAANGTINRELTALKRMLNIGARQTPPKVDRVPYISMLREDNVRKGFFEHSEFIALRDNLPEHLKTFVTFAYKTGWRLEEIATLQWNQVDIDNGIVRLEPGETKNDEGRTVYLDNELNDRLRKLRKEQNDKGIISSWVFLNKKGNNRIKRFDKSWKSACEKAGIGIKLFHDLRRTAVRNMVRSGIPERVAMMISGHKTRSVFDRYNIVSDSDLRNAANLQEKYLEGTTGTISGTVTKIK